MEKEYLTIAEFSKRANVTKQTIYNRIDKDLKSFVKVENNVKLIEISALSKFNTKTIQKESNSNDNFIEYLQKENEKKDKIIEEKEKNIQELTERIADLTEKSLQIANQAQILQLQEQKRKAPFFKRLLLNTKKTTPEE